MGEVFWVQPCPPQERDKRYKVTVVGVAQRLAAPVSRICAPQALCGVRTGWAGAEEPLHTDQEWEGLSAPPLVFLWIPSHPKVPVPCSQLSHDPKMFQC